MNARRGSASPFRERGWIDKVATNVAPATVAAVAVALPLIPSEAVATGSTILIDLAIFCGLAVWAVSRVLAGQRHSRLDGSSVDMLLGLFFVWFAGSAARMIDMAHGRPAINVTWAWLGGGGLWFLARQSLRAPQTLRAMAAVLCAVAAGLASYSFYQCGYQMPRDRAAFRRDPEAVLREAGIVAPEGSPIREQFRNRVESREPIATFALTNSLAGYLLPSLVICLAGVAAARYGWQTRHAVDPLETNAPSKTPVKRPGGTPREGRESRVHNTSPIAIAWTVAAIAVAGCLLLTKSRSAYVATLFAGAAIGWNLLRGGERIGWKIPMAVVGTSAVLTVLAAATGFLDIQVLSEARLSLGYRWEYWTSTIAMIRDFPLNGCGAGNYQSFYTAYKLPQASEVVADPHNFVFELAAIAGVPALAAWLAAFALWLATIVRGTTHSRSGPSVTETVPLAETPAFDRASATGSAALSAMGSAASGSLEQLVEPDTSGAVWVGAALGLPLAAIAGMLAGYPPSAMLLATGVPPAFALLFGLRRWVREGELPAFALPVATLAVLVNLLAAGGIGFPAVATGWWLVGAMGLNRVERTQLGWVAPRWLWGVVAASVGMLVIAFYLTCYRPVFESQSRIAAATLAGERGDLRAVLDELQAAADADPWSSAAWVQLAGFRHRQWLEGGASPAREEFERAVLEALRRDHRAHSLRRELGDLFLDAYAKMGDRAALGDAVALYRDAIALYPNHAPHHAQLACALWAAGERNAGRVAAREALRLDALNPHREQKLDAQRLRTVESATSARPKSANAREWVEWIVRETSESN